MGLLSIAIWLPIAFGTLLLAVGRDRNARAVRALALVGAIASFVVTFPLVTGFEGSSAAMQFVEKLPWIPRFNAWYHLGIDGLSLWFVPLTAFITVVVVIARGIALGVLDVLVVVLFRFALSLLGLCLDRLAVLLRAGLRGLRGRLRLGAHDAATSGKLVPTTSVIDQLERASQRDQGPAGYFSAL